MKKKILGSIVILAIVAVAILNVTLVKSEKIVSLSLNDLSTQAYADETDAVSCLVVHVIETKKGFVASGKCYRDAPGADVFEGYTGNCSAGGTNCNAASCSNSNGCYIG
jgi:hypothetical protein